MPEFSKEEVEKMVEEAVIRAMKGVFAVSLTEVVHCAVTKAMSEYTHECVFDLSQKEVEAVESLIGAIKSVGHGDIEKGAENIRDNHAFVSRLRIKLDKAGDTVTSCILKAVTTIVLSAFGLGVVFLLYIKSGNGSPPHP